eukprot:g8806.t2
MENEPASNRGSSVGDSPTEAGMPAVDVKVSRFAKHPSGHAVYECVVELPQTRQVWLVFKRYREFVTLRQHLKSACQGHHQKRGAPTARGDIKSHAPAKRLSGRAGSAPGLGAAQVGLNVGVGSKADRVSANGDRASSELIASVETILSECRFPSRLALGRSFSLKQERRKALHAFLAALAKLRPLPRVVARFLGLLENDRMALDQCGNYVRVMRVDSVIPLPPSQDLEAGGPNKRPPIAQDRGDAGVRSQPTLSPAASPTEAKDKAGEGEVSATATAAPARGSGDRSDETPHVAGGSAASRRYRQQPSVGSRMWEGVNRTADVEMAVSSDTEDPTDSESGSDSEPEYADDIGGNKRVGSTPTCGVAADVIADGPSRGGSGGVDGTGDKPQVFVADVSPHQESETPTTTLPSPAVDPSSSQPPVARLRGGGAEGGGEGSDDDSDGAGAKHMMAWRDGEQTDGWSMVASEEGDEDDECDGDIGARAKGMGGEAGWAGDTGCREDKQERDGEQEERMVQWEFVNGYLEEVVAKVVGRQDLSVGMGTSIANGTSGGAGAGSSGGGGSGDGGMSPFPISSEERDVRLAELMSFGVDLPNEMLITMLRFKDWGPTEATALYQDLVAAGKGQLNAVTPGAPIRGIENGGNTCYIDSLLFAMFATLDAFDWLLFKPLPPTDPPEVKLLQKHLRFFVNQLRGGATVPREHSNLIRNHLRTCGWQGGPSSQEDVTELFTFLVCLLRCPALPLSEALFHGGKVEAGDSRISTERALFLALPDEEKEPELKKPKSLSPNRSRKTGSSTDPTGSRSPPRTRTDITPAENQDAGLLTATASKRDGSKDVGGGGVAPGTGAGVTLEQILMHNFHNNRVEGLRRTVSGEKGSQPVDAWRMVSMLPFYALSGEHDGDSDPSNDKHFDTIMLPMVLKRYEAPDPAATPATSSTASSVSATAAKKSRRKVVVPHRLDVSNFMAPSAGAKGGAAQDHGGRFVLVLRSAVCHLGGESVSKGHYVAYSADREETSCDTSATAGVSKKSDGGSRKKLDPDGLSQSMAAHEGERIAKSGEDSSTGQDSVTWLRLDDLKESPTGRGFVERLDGVREAHEVFSEDLGLHSYMLFYELVPLNLDDADKAQVKETLAYMETASDYMIAEQLNLAEQLAVWSSARGGAGKGGGVGQTSGFCPVS